jgi:hypothetical protein
VCNSITYILLSYLKVFLLFIYQFLLDSNPVSAIRLAGILIIMAALLTLLIRKKNIAALQ